MHKLLLNLVSVFVAFSLAIFTLPGRTEAMFLPAPAAEPETDPGAGNTLEALIVEQRLTDLGLTSQEISARMSVLSDSQIHGFAAEPDSLQAGGEAVEILVIVLIAAVITVGVLEFTGNSVMVRH